MGIPLMQGGASEENVLQNTLVSAPPCSARPPQPCQGPPQKLRAAGAEKFHRGGAGGVWGGSGERLRIHQIPPPRAGANRRSSNVGFEKS